MAGLPTSMFGGEGPLSQRERSALLRILSASTRDKTGLGPRQRAALDAYSEILSTPPVSPIDVVRAARAMIRIWGDPLVPKPKQFKRGPSFIAELLDLDDEQVVAPQISPLTSDLVEGFVFSQPASEQSTEVVEPVTPDWVRARDRVHGLSRLADEPLF
jgi:hypothetical protein